MPRGKLAMIAASKAVRAFLWLGPENPGRSAEIGFDPVAGEELEALAREVIAQPAEAIERMKRLLEK